MITVRTIRALACHLVLAGLLLHPGGAWGIELLQQGFRSEYAVYRNRIYLGITTREFRPVGNDRWEYVAHTVPKGLVAMLFKDQVHERSVSRRAGDLFVPVEYTFEQTGGRREKKYHLVFDDRSGIVKAIHSDQTYPMYANTKDLLSFQLQLMSDLAGKKRDIIYSIADRKRLKTFALTVLPDENIETLMGNFLTTPVTSKSTDSKNTYNIWCAVTLQYLPVKIQRVEDDGDVIEFLIKRMTPGTATP